MSQKRLNKIFGVDLAQHKIAQIKDDDQDVLQVIGAGLPRSGTTSLKAALEILGFDPCHHKTECVEHPERSIGFAQFLRSPTEPSSQTVTSRAAKLKGLMRGYRATVDSPGCDLYRELMVLYPNAKVVLSVRDSDDHWWKSFNGTIVKQLNARYTILTYPMGFLRKQKILLDALVARWVGLPGVAVLGPALHASHNAQVRATVPKERLLEFNVKMGWPRLCEFLEVPVPDQPFPKLNDAAMLSRAIVGAQMLGACAWLLYLGIFAVSLILLFWPKLILHYFRS